MTATRVLHGGMRACFKRGRDGVMGLWVIVMLSSLIGMAALVVDIGRLIVVAQHVQNVADASALAGAGGLPDTQVANTRLQQMVQTNNQEMPNFAVFLTPGSDVVIYAPAQNVPGYGVLDNDAYACEVTAHSTVQYTFARMFGLEETTVTRSATALSEPASSGGGGGGGVFFAEETAPNLWGIVVNGSHQTFGGDVHSNTMVAVNGAHQTVSGTLRYRHQLRLNGAQQDIEDTEETDIQQYPIDYSYEDYEYTGPFDYVFQNAYYNGNNQTLPSGTWEIDGDLSINGSGFTARDSTFVVRGNIYLNEDGFEADNCLFISENGIYASGEQIDFNESTFVARGPIYFNDALKQCSYKRDADGLFALSESTSGITYNGARQRTEGIIFAPNGPVTYNGARQEVYNGGVAAKTITINGAHGTFNPHDEYGFGGGSAGDRKVSLIQ
ncbi:MAG: pilus assembly protein TadG-related protein [Armatimonadota bacterium]